jgi:hypothetical protein
MKRFAPFFILLAAFCAAGRHHPRVFAIALVCSRPLDVIDNQHRR